MAVERTCDRCKKRYMRTTRGTNNCYPCILELQQLGREKRKKMLNERRERNEVEE